MNLLEIFLKGGWIMWPILLTSVIVTAVAINRAIVIRKSRTNVPAFLVKIRGLLRKKDVQGAIVFCAEEKSPVSNIIRKGLKKYKLGHERVKEAIENAGRQEVAKLEKGLPVLATIVGIAPLMGFLGTVTGMISAFMRIENLSGNASPSDLAAGIWEALLTTAFGLIVGIPAYAFYNYFLSKIKKTIMDMEVVSNDVVDIIEETGGAEDKQDDKFEIEL